ncbi:unnamed protein product [Calicophoron daubneyi]|uniref:Uncharacterized protein n=1 Tax=Calicophoron daubneyi TaxID=300641 RepID=A0AAV2TRI2_CALDB
MSTRYERFIYFLGKTPDFSMPAIKNTEENSEVLTRFLNSLPISDRANFSSTLVRIRGFLEDVIPRKNRIKRFIVYLNDLRNTFSHLPLSVRQHLKLILIDGLQHSIRSSSIPFSIFTMCLCLLELNATRNPDRLDLEGQDVWSTISLLNEVVFPQLSQLVLAQRTNIPCLYSWALGTLAFTFEACLEWLRFQDCFPESVHSSDKVLKIDPAALSHESLPLFIRSILKIQQKRRTYLNPPSPFTLLDLLFCSATSNLLGFMEKSLLPSKLGGDVSPLEATEPRFRKPSANKLEQNELHKYLNTIADLTDTPVESYKESLLTGSNKDVLSNLRMLHSGLRNANKHSKQYLLTLLAVTLRYTTEILIRTWGTVKDQENKKVSEFEEVVHLLLQLWFHGTEERILLQSSLNQSSLWLVGFMQPHYESMSDSGFFRAVVWVSRLLTRYQSLFRSAILESPHWYLQMITDVVVAVINRLEKTRNGLTQNMENTMCSCIVAISRPFCALGADEVEVRPDLSRAIKNPLETIVSRMASCQSAFIDQPPAKAGKKRKRTAHGYAATCVAVRPVLGTRIRELLANYLIIPMIKATDPWALGQIRIGIRPVSAKILFKQLLMESESLDDEVGEGTVSKLKLPRIVPAVGGLHVTEKLAVSKQKR